MARAESFRASAVIADVRRVRGGGFQCAGVLSSSWWRVVARGGESFLVAEPLRVITRTTIPRSKTLRRADENSPMGHGSGYVPSNRAAEAARPGLGTHGVGIGAAQGLWQGCVPAARTWLIYDKSDGSDVDL